jgi:hypothetical protein
MGVFGKIGGGFKWLGKKILGLIRSDEALFAVKFLANRVPVLSAIDDVVALVRYIDGDDKSGPDKFATALASIEPILKEYGIEIEDESDIHFIIELAVKIMKGRARAIKVD